VTSLFFAFLKTFPLGVTFKVQLGVRVGVSIIIMVTVKALVYH